MEVISIVGLVTFGFAAANLVFQLGAIHYVRRGLPPGAPLASASPERSGHWRIDGSSRTRTDRHDLQLAIGHDFAAPDVDDQVWPRA